MKLLYPSLNSWTRKNSGDSQATPKLIGVGRIAMFRSITLVALTLTVVATRLPAQEIDFNRDVRTILSDKCFKCHGPDEESREADLRLDDLAAAEHVLELEDGTSELVRRITSDDADEKMPPPKSKMTLSVRETELLTRWVNAGAAYNQHWSFQSIKKPALPDVSTDWIHSEIDRFIYAQMLSAGFQPQQEAPRERLIRRLSFDLTGLPPKLEQVDAFVNDHRADAYERLVDQLLESDAFGERMASDWLDVARYSDTYGYQVDRDRYVWPWRDWVIRAINDNLPYDQFVTWQLAGDLLPNPTDDQVLATTFSRLHPQKVEGGSVPEEFRVEYVADRSHTFATAFLGLTMECCRCHDHKYDPITQKEYYQLFAFFNNIDEAGLYSYFTESVPTPNMLITDDQRKHEIRNVEQEIHAAEERLASIEPQATDRFDVWLKTDNPSEELIPGQVAHLTFEDTKEPNKIVEGVQGMAAELTGDDAIGLDVGNFTRYQPFSISLWMKTPDIKERAVVFHRSRAWTDSASRGYQLLLEDGRVSFSLIHFWPGNAIRIKAKSQLPINVWQHLVVTYDGSSRADGVRIYRNGNLDSTEVVRDNLYKNITGSGGDNIAIGERFRDRGFTKGQVDEFKVFNRQLTAIEAKQLYDEKSLSVLLKSTDRLDEDGRSALKAFYLSTKDEAYRKQLAELQSVREERSKLVDGIQEIMVMAELPNRRKSYVLSRGAYDAPTVEVEPDVPTALSSFPKDAPRNRLGLAQWLTDPDNPLASRVAVNRFWKIVFGNGLVRTPEDFGSQGALPTHPQLLDWLAKDFIENGWDVKRLIKQMVMSATYRQDSKLTKERYQKDPQNVFLARAPHYRLPAEMLRDNIMASSGILVNKIGGPSTKPYEVAASFKPVDYDKGEGLYRRSLYTYWKRTAPAPVMMTLDAAKRDVCSVKRERTTSALQAFVLLNDPQFVEGCRVLAENVMREHGADPDGMIDLVFQKLTSRKPSEREHQILVKLFAEQQAYFAADKNRAVEYLKTGVHARDESLDSVDVAATTVVVSTVMNFDEAIMKR